MSKVIKIHKGREHQKSGIPIPRGTDLAEADFLSYEALLQINEDKFGVTGKKKRELERARNEAEEIVAKAKAEAAAIEEEARGKGHEEGLQQGLAEGGKKIDEAVEKLTGLLDSIRDHREELNRKYLQEVLGLIKAMVNRLVDHEVSVNPRVIRACLKKSLEYVVENSEVKVHLNGEDFRRVKEAGLSDPALLEGKSRLHLIENPNVSMGGCLLESDFGEIDATFENRRDILLKAVDQAFMAALAQEGPDKEKG